MFGLFSDSENVLAYLIFHGEFLGKILYQYFIFYNLENSPEYAWVTLHNFQ